MVEKLELAPILNKAYSIFVDGLYEASFYTGFNGQLRQLLESGQDIPDSVVPFKLGESKKSTIKMTFQEYGNRYAVLAGIISVENLLLTPLIMLRVLKQALKEGLVTVEHLNRIQIASKKNVKHKHVWDLLKNEDEQFQNSQLEPHFTSLRYARNCLAHRGGLVSDLDLNGKELFEIKWIDITLGVNGQPINRLPFQVNQGGNLEIIQKEKTVTYKEGQKINLSERDTHSILWTLLQFGESVNRQTANLVQSMLK